MRHIIKGEPDEYLAKQHQRPSTTQYKRAKSRWDSFRKNKKSVGTRKQCFENEQFGLCGYSEVGLLTGEGMDKELGFHLEHIQPKKVAPEKTFDHNNLIVSAIDDWGKRVAKEDIFGGHAHGNWWDDEAFIHPLLPDCSRYFHYDRNGEVTPNRLLPDNEQSHAQLTIDNLNLNAPILVGWREKWMAQKLMLIEGFIEEPAVLRQLARAELLPQNGQLKPFHSAIRQLFGHIADEIMAESPEATGATPI